MATKTYQNITQWSDEDIHLLNIDIGPHGDNLHGHLSITGDRWTHERIGLAKAPSAKLLQPVDVARIEPPTIAVSAGDILPDGVSHT